jgi:Arc/MetJ-type ribon-helix-helix transcriptional regulator
MADKKRVNLTVNPETKEEWDNAVEESTEYSSLSDLIRQSVAHELSEPLSAAPRTAEGRETQQTAQAEAHMEALERVTDTLARMENTLTDLDERLTNVEQEVTASAQADLKNQVFDALPEYQSDDGPDGKSAEEIAEEIGADRERIGSILRQLEQQTGIVRVVGNIEGQQFFTREEEK